MIRAITRRPAPEPRRAVYRRLLDPGEGTVLDRGFILWFPGPGSFTGEDVAELHVHGGRATVRAVLDVLTGPLGARLAEPGEFTRRAFENGKLDLTAAEALADLVDAETEAQRRQAVRQLDGALGRLYEGWREDLVAALAHLEAQIDFPDEDIPADVMTHVRARVVGLAGSIEAHLADNRRGERLRDGFRIVILGAPNVGKSSLLNALARRDAAIVSAQAGTTRDVIETHLDLGGFPVVLVDTAGLRESLDVVEREGVRRARRHAAEADFRIVLFDAGDWPALDPISVELADDTALPVINKVDQVRPRGPMRVSGKDAIAISVATGEGIETLLKRIETIVDDWLGDLSAPALTRERHRLALRECRSALQRACDGESPELVAEDLRLAARALGRITGRVGVEDLLDVIFRDFCIGK